MYSIVLAASLSAAPATPAWFHPWPGHVSGSFTAYGFLAPYGYSPWYLPAGYWYPVSFYPVYDYPALYYPAYIPAPYAAYYPPYYYPTAYVLPTVDHRLEGVRRELHQLNHALRNLEEQIRADQRREAQLRVQAQEIRIEASRALERLRTLEGSLSGKKETVGPPRKDVIIPKKKSKTGLDSSSNNRGRKALVIVSLPADATLYLDGQARKGNNPVRSFLTPDLEEGATYYYTVRVDVERDGRLLSQSRRVEFRAGSEVRVAFEQLGRTGRAPALSSQ
jgi:uncharacterized protein (TIGR03000 family)